MPFRRFLDTLYRSTAVCALLTVPSAAVLAQSVTPLPAVPVQTQDSGTTLNTTTLSPDALATKAAATDDAAALLLGIPGVDLNTGGGFSGLPSIHGLADDRIKTLIDGVPITSSCPNHMNPALSYIAPVAVGKAEVIAGITPVSAGGDSIGGTISVEPVAPVFANPGEGIRYGGLLSTSFRSVNNALTSSVGANTAGENVSFGVTAMRAHATSYRDGDGDVVHGSQYETYSGDGTFAVRGDGQSLVIRGGQTFSPYEGFPNQPMDLTYNQSNHVNARYQGEFNWGNLDARAYWQDVRHQMNFLYGWQNGPVGSGMPMLTRGEDVGYSVKAEIPLSKQDTLRVGNELHLYTLNDWWPATMAMTSAMGPGTFQNIADGQRDVLGTYAEWEKAWTPQWTSLLGARNDMVRTDAGNVQGYNNANSAMGTNFWYGTDAAAFNAQNHAKLDANFDVTALARYQASDTNTDEVGYARKSRSPNLYERYAWSSGSMAASMIGWFGDNNNYVGNVSLKPEVANTFSTTAEWHDAAKKDWDIKVTPYYNYVENYIGVDQLTSFNGHALTGYRVLQFNNHDAQLFGADVSGRKILASDTPYGEFDVAGKIGWVRGEQINNGENLYHMMPVNGLVTFGQTLGGWKNAIDVQAVSSKTMVDTLRNEPVTPGYALVNLRSMYTWQNVALNFGIENLFNKQYYSPLGGIDLKDFRYDNARGSEPYTALPGSGRSFDAGVTVKF